MMTQLKIRWALLLAAVVLLLSLAWMPEQTYARYNTAVCWNTVLGGGSSVVQTSQSPVLTDNHKTLVFSLSEEVGEPQCRLEILSADQSYTAFTADTITVTVADGTVTVQIGDILPPAGTYRLVIAWTTEATAGMQTAAVTFFINYSAG